MKTPLRKILDKQGRSVTWLVRYTKLTRYKIEGAVYGYRPAKPDEMAKIAEVLQLPVELIFVDPDPWGKRV